MHYLRWYPTATKLPDGRILATSGTRERRLPADPRGLQPGANTWTALPSANGLHPVVPVHVRAPRRADRAGRARSRADRVQILNPANWTWSTVDASVTDAGSAVMYQPGKILRAGSSGFPGTASQTSSANAYVLDMTAREPAPASGRVDDEPAGVPAADDAARRQRARDRRRQEPRHQPTRRARRTRPSCGRPRPSSGRRWPRTRCRATTTRPRCCCPTAGSCSAEVGAAPAGPTTVSTATRSSRRRTCSRAPGRRSPRRPARPATAPRSRVGDARRREHHVGGPHRAGGGHPQLRRERPLRPAELHASRRRPPDHGAAERQLRAARPVHAVPRQQQRRPLRRPLDQHSSVEARTSHSVPQPVLFGERCETTWSFAPE